LRVGKIRLQSLGGGGYMSLIVKIEQKRDGVITISLNGSIDTLPLMQIFESSEQLNDYLDTLLKESG